MSSAVQLLVFHRSFPDVASFIFIDTLYEMKTFVSYEWASDTSNKEGQVQTHILKPLTKFLANFVGATAGATFAGVFFNLSNSSSASISCSISLNTAFS